MSFAFTEPNKIEGVILNKNHFEAFIRDLLLVKQYRVEVYVNQGSAKNQDWIIEYKGSPGNLIQFEDILFGNNDIVANSSVIAIKLATEGRSKVRNIHIILLYYLFMFIIILLFKIFSENCYFITKTEKILFVLQVLGLSCIDTVSTVISVCEFKDDDSFSNLEALLVTLAPKECLIIEGAANAELNTLKQVCE